MIEIKHVEAFLVLGTLLSGFLFLYIFSSTFPTIL